MRFELYVCIPPTRFELVSPAPKAGMIDRYTTGVDNVLVEYTSQISLLKICFIYFSAEDIKISIRSRLSGTTREIHKGESAKCIQSGQWGKRSAQQFLICFVHRGSTHSLKFSNASICFWISASVCRSPVVLVISGSFLTLISPIGRGTPRAAWKNGYL